MIHPPTTPHIDVCNWCSDPFGKSETKCHLDGSLFHGKCIKPYIRNKGKLIVPPPGTWLCPMGGHTHRNL